MPSFAELQKIAKFYNSMSLLGSKSLASEDEAQMQFMTLKNKVDHVKHELNLFLAEDDSSIIKNTLFASDSCTYSEIRQVMSKITSQERLINTLMPPNMTMGFPMMQFPQFV